MRTLPKERRYETLSFLPPLSDLQIRKQLQYILDQGFIAGVEFKNNQIALKTYEKMSENGLISTLIQGNVIRLTPPLTVSAGEIREAIKIITQSL